MTSQEGGGGAGGEKETGEDKGRAVMGLKTRGDLERRPQQLGVCFFICSLVLSFNRRLWSTYYVLRPRDVATAMTSHWSCVKSL